jgi:membrane-bound metal-dependent hydrolase YbcI (DUF457 family)
MPSPIGHALAGAATAWAIDPRAGRRLTLVAAGLAALPDVDLMLPVRHRTGTHSIGAVIAVTIIAAIVTGQVTRHRVWRTVCICGAAYATHLLLDWLAADLFFPYGLQVWWPFSDRFYISGWELFAQTERVRLFTAPVLKQNIQAIAQEIAILGPLVLAIWLVRVKPTARLAPELPSRHHPAQ